MENENNNENITADAPSIRNQPVQAQMSSAGLAEQNR